MKYVHPGRIPGTTRKRVTSSDGMILERQSVYLPPACWDILTKLCQTQGRSGSKIIESLILLADASVKKNF